MWKKVVLALFLFLTLSQCKQLEEPHCSKYDFEEKVLEKMVRMEFQMETMKSEMTKSVNRIENLKEKVSDTLMSVTEKTKTIKDDLGNMTELETKLAKSFNHFQDKFAALENETAKTLENLEASLKERIATSTVAFKARLNNDNISVASGQTIVFPTILFNAGDAYSNDTGKFTAPVSGIYLFTVAFCIKYQKTLVAAIMVDGTKYAVTLLYGDGNHECISADTIAVLNNGQRVWVEPVGSSGSIIHQGSSRWNTFSGTILQKKVLI